MLTLTRNVGETIIIGDNIQVTVAEVRGHTARLSIDAPREIRILREEVHQRIQLAEQIAAAVAANTTAALAAATSPATSTPSSATDIATTEAPDRRPAVIRIPDTTGGTGQVHITATPETEPTATTESTGWTHTQAKQHTLIERLLERCATHNGGAACATQDNLTHDDWCERCLSAEALALAGLGHQPTT